MADSSSSVSDRAGDTNGPSSSNGGEQVRHEPIETSRAKNSTNSIMETVTEPPTSSSSSTPPTTRIRAQPRSPHEDVAIQQQQQQEEEEESLSLQLPPPDIPSVISTTSPSTTKTTLNNNENTQAHGNANGERHPQQASNGRYVRPESPEILQNVSELSDGPFFEHHRTNSPGKKMVHDFFFPPRQKQPPPQQQQQQEEDEDVDLNATITKRIHNRQQRRSKSKGPPLPSLLADHHHDSDGTPLESRSPPPTAVVVATNTTFTTTTTTMTTTTTLDQRSSIASDSSDGVAPQRSSLVTAADTAYLLQEQQDKDFVERFWTIYDELLILSLFTQIGILCRLAAASFFGVFDGVFHPDSALFTNLPLNCLSCFVMGMLCSGESLMEIISTRFTPPRLQQDLHREAQMEQRLQQQGPQQNWQDELSDDDDMQEMETAGVMRRRKRRRRRRKRSSSLFQRQRAENLLTELREVQLLAWERRIRASNCLLLFPVKQEDVDVVEDYFSDGYRRQSDNQSQTHPHETNTSTDHNWHVHYTIDEEGEENEAPLNDMEEGGFDDLILQEEDDDNDPSSLQQATSQQSTASALSTTHPPSTDIPRNVRSSSMPASFTRSSSPAPPVATNATTARRKRTPRVRTSSDATPTPGRAYAHGVPHIRRRQFQQLEGGQVVDYGTHDNPDLDQMIERVATGVQQNISRIGRVNLANGWDVGTSPQEKSEDLMLGLRDGLCGALSSFSSWISSMVNLFRSGQIGQGFVGLVLGIQLPLVAYRFGQYVSVYVFVWRCRREKQRDEKRGYGIQLHVDDDSSMDDFADRSHHSGDSGDEMSASASPRTGRTKGRRTVHDEESEVPSVRAIVTALCIMALVAQLTALHFFYEPQDRLLALSLLFSPLGVLARWRMMKFNSWRPSFPIGTFACNISACALAGTLGTLIAGNPGPRERIALVAIIAGFGGTLSSVARFIVEVIAGMDPVLFRLDGMVYAVASVFWGIFVSFLFSASVDWADSTEAVTNDLPSVMPSVIPTPNPSAWPTFAPSMFNNTGL